MADFYYNLTNLTQVNNTIADVMRYPNEVTGGMFWIISLPVLWIILFSVMVTRYGSRMALMSSLFATTGYSYVLASLGFISVSITLIFTIMTVFMILLMAIPRGT